MTNTTDSDIGPPTPPKGGVLILGATGGMGSATAHALSKKGVPLTLAAPDESKLNELAGELETETTCIALDATDPDAVDNAVKKTTETYDGIAGAVNCVGSIILKPAHSTKIEEYRETLALNLDTAFFLMRACGKAMAKHGGSVVFVSSAVARHGFAAHEAIAAAKAGVIGLAQSAAASYATKGIRVNVVAPALTDTKMAAPVVGNEPALKASLGMTPNNRLGTPEAVASAIAWFLDHDQWHVTGQVLGVDGGMSTVRSK